MVVFLRKIVCSSPRLPQDKSTNGSFLPEDNSSTFKKSHYLLKRTHDHMVFLRRYQIEGKYNEISYLTSNGISPTSTGEEFDEETNSWRFPLYLRYCPKS